jgi:TP901 family phage tail tape measure protein
LALAGYDTQQMYDTLPTVLNLAAAGSMDLATASDMVTDAMSALGMGTDEATTMVDQMAKTASSSNTSVAELGDAILTIGGTAKTVAGGTAELNTALGILANNGVKGSEGGTHLRNVIMSLQSPTDTAAKMINSLGLEVYDAQGEMRPLNDILGDLNSTMDGMTTEEKQNIISTIFNKTDIASVNALLANTGDTWDELQATITDSSGAAQQMADTQLDNLQGQLTLLQSAVEGLAISIGNIILPAIKNFVTYVQKAVDWLNSLSDGTKTAVVAIAAIAASIGPALVAIGKMSTGMSKVIKFFNSGATIGGKLVASFASITGSAGLAVVAIGAIVAAIAAVVGAFVNLWNNNQEFHDNIIGIWNSIKETWESFTSGITERLNTLGFSFEDFSEVVSAVWNGFCEVLAPVFEGAFSVVADVFTTITNTILDIWDIFSALFQGDWDGVWQGVQTLFGDVWQGICDLFSDCWDTIKGVADTILGFFGTDWDSCFQTVSETWNSIWQGISDFFNGIIEGIKAIASPFVDWFKSIFGDGNDEIETDNAETWTTVKTDTSTALSDIKSDSSKKWSDISSDLSDSLSKIKQNVSDKWSEIKEKTSDTFTTIKEKISDKWSDIKSNTSDKISSIKENISSKWSDIKSSTSDTFSTIKSNTGSTLSKMVSSFASNFSSMKSTTSTQMSGIQSSSSSGMSGTYQVVCNQLTNIKAQFVSVWNACVSTVSSAVSRLKGLMNFSWSLPHIKVPHFSLSGSFDLKKMTVPTISVSWYAKAMKDAMIFNQPTIFGYNSATGAFMGAGEAGSETLVGTQTLMNMISVASQSGIDRTTSAVNDMYDWMANGGLVDQMVNAVENRLMIKLNEREVGRVVKRNV